MAVSGLQAAAGNDAVQRLLGGTPAVQRQPDREAPRVALAASSMTVSLAGLRFEPVEGAVFAPGSRFEQYMSMVLRRLCPSAPSDELVSDAAGHLLAGPPIDRTPGAQGRARGGEPAGTLRIAPRPSQRIIAFLESRDIAVRISADQRQVLGLGQTAKDAWKAISDPQLSARLGLQLPGWFTEPLFLAEAANHAALLRRVSEAVARVQAARNDATIQALHDAMLALVNALRPAAAALEAVRADASLIAHPGYRLLWPPPAPRGNARAVPPPRQAEAAEAPAPDMASAFLGFVRTQPQLLQQVETDAAARRELLDRFVRWAGSALPAGPRDQPLSEAPALANRPPWPSQLASSPVLEPPLFDAALGTDHAFVMQIQFGTVFDAFVSYSYQWDRIRVPEQRRGTDVSDLQGERPGWGEVAGERYARAARYGIEDIRRVVDAVGVEPGVGAISLAGANNILRFVGTTVSLGIDMLTTPRSERRVVLPSEGLWVIRCRAVPIPGEGAEIVRPPSVAYLPVLARDPRAMAESRTLESAAAQGEAAARLSELRVLLAQPDVANRAELERERAELELALGPVSATLAEQRRVLQERVNQLPAWSPERREAERQLERVDQLIEVRQEREESEGLAGAENIVATFVSDQGQTIRLTLEAVRRTPVRGRERWYVSDLTTPDSGHATATGATRAEAIVAAITAILESTSGYGRGQLSAFVDGQARQRRIAASAGALLMEALENVATAASIAAIAAAPFTGGASLSLLLPIGLVGAVPSAYRLATRAEAGTLRFDLATAMDVINIAGGLAGLGQPAAALGWVRLGRALMITGVGANGLGVFVMGADMIVQIEALQRDSSLTPGQRAARVMDIIGNAMLQAGIAVGEAVVARGRATDLDARSRPGGPAPDAATSGRELVREPGTLGVRSSADGRHQVKITERGRIAVCSYPCQFLRDRFGNELATRPDLEARVTTADTDIETAIRDLAAGTIDQAAHDAIIERALTEAVTLEGELRALRHGYLAYDPTSRRNIPHEGTAGQHLEDLLGRPVERSMTDPAYDFRDPVTRRTYDALGPVPPVHFDSTPARFRAWAESLREHLRKRGLDIVFLDLSGLNPAQRARALAELRTQLASHTPPPGVVVYP
jgi:hypothetical protein